MLEIVISRGKSRMLHRMDIIKQLQAYKKYLGGFSSQIKFSLNDDNLSSCKKPPKSPQAADKLPIHRKCDSL
jgi:hypothetical protein